MATFRQERTHEGLIGFATRKSLERQRATVEMRLGLVLSASKRVQLACTLIRIDYALELIGLPREVRPSNRERVRVLRRRQGRFKSRSYLYV